MGCDKSQEQKEGHKHRCLFSSVEGEEFVVDVVFQVLRRFDPLLVFDCRYSLLQQY